MIRTKFRAIANVAPWELSHTDWRASATLREQNILLSTAKRSENDSSALGFADAPTEMHRNDRITSGSRLSQSTDQRHPTIRGRCQLLGQSGYAAVFQMGSIRFVVSGVHASKIGDTDRIPGSGDSKIFGRGMR